MAALNEAKPLLNQISFDFGNKMEKFFNSGPDFSGKVYERGRFMGSPIYNGSEHTSGILLLFKNNNEEFVGKFEELEQCLFENLEILNELDDININNTVYLEILQNGGIKGLGPVFFKLIKNIAHKTGNKYKYIFLYPSQGFGSGQEFLLKYYRDLGFKKLNPCINNLSRNLGQDERMEYFDKVPYYLIVAKIENLKVDHVEFPEDKIKYGGNEYKEKYLKYKAKYMKLKSSFE